MFGHAGNHVAWCLPEPLRPVLPHQIVVAADAARRDDHGLCLQREVADDFARTAFSPLDDIRLEDRPADAIDGAVLAQERIDPVAEFEGELAVPNSFARPPLERLDNARTGAPRDGEARHRIALTQGIVPPALAPADPRKQSVTHGSQPGPFFPCRKADIGFRPTPRP